MPPFKDMRAVRLANSAMGYHFFEPETMAFFNSRIESELIRGRFFVTSEQFDETTPRLYTLREVKPDGHIDTVGDFQFFTSAAAAVDAALQRHATGD